MPAAVGVLTFAAIAGWFAARVLRRQPPVAQAGHVVVASVAMVLMYVTQHGAALGGRAGGGHGSRRRIRRACGRRYGSPVAMALALALTGYFVWHAWDSGVRRWSAARPSTMWSVPAAHVVLSGLMAVMCLGAV